MVPLPIVRGLQLEGSARRRPTHGWGKPSRGGAGATTPPLGAGSDYSARAGSVPGLNCSPPLLYTMPVRFRLYFEPGAPG